MPALKIEQVGGQLPAWDPHLLPAGQAAAAVNLYPFGGRAEGWRKPKLLRNLTNSAAKFVYRVPAITQAAATAYLLFQAQPNNGDMVTVGSVTYTFKTVLVSQFDVLIGATAQGSASNFLAALTTDAGQQTNEGTLYGINTTANSVIGYGGAGTTSGLGYAPLGSGSGSAAYIPFVAAVGTVVGTSLNTVGVSTTATGRLLWLADTNSINDTTATLANGANSNLNNAVTAPSSWIELLDPDSNVVRSQVLNDFYQRYYIASPSTLPQYNTAARITAGQPAFKLGINPPLMAPGVNPTGGGDTFTAPSSAAAASAENVTDNFLWVFPYVPTQAVELSDVVFLPDATAAGTNFAGVVYNDLTGTVGSPTVPGQLLGTGSIVTGIASGVQAVTSFVNPIALEQGVPVWIGILIDTTTEIFKNAALTSTSYSVANTFTNGPPGVFPAGSANQPDLCMFGVFNTSAILEARAYVYTWVSAYQEESAPSPFNIQTGWTNGPWNLTFAPPLPDDLGVHRNLVTTRIYRTVTGATGATSYFWVTDIPITQTQYQDNAQDSVIAENISLPSANYFPPPANLQGLTIMPNGMIAGFIGNQIWICQPYLPHAWPPGNVFNTDFPIVGLGFTNGVLVACTEANPYILSGANPSVMSITKLQPPDPCLARGSILSTDLGVYYMSPNGLMQVTSIGQATNTTELWITREKWAALVPLTFGAARAVPLAGTYFCYGTNPTLTGALPAGNSPGTPNGFMLELNTDTTSFTIWPQPGGHRVGFSQMTPPSGFYIDNIIIDPWTGYALIVQGGATYYYDFTDPSPVMQPFSYTSKIYQQNNKKNFAAARAFFTVPASTPAQNATPNTLPASDPSWQSLNAGQYAILLVYADVGGVMTLMTAREITSSGGLLRILSGFKAENWQFQVIGQVPISNIQVATSITELGNV